MRINRGEDSYFSSCNDVEYCMEIRRSVVKGVNKGKNLYCFLYFRVLACTGNIIQLYLTIYEFISTQIWYSRPTTLENEAGVSTDEPRAGLG